MSINWGIVLGLGIALSFFAWACWLVTKEGKKHSEDR